MSFDDIPENVAAVVFSHLGGDPTDRIRLSAVSKVWWDAEKADASLPGTPRALYELGKGLDCPTCRLPSKLLTLRDEDYVKMIYWLRKAADRGDADAMSEIGYDCVSGHGVNKDWTKAKEWWERASDCGHAHATYKLALCYRYELYGVGVETNEARAIELYTKAAEMGSGLAAHALGRIYELGPCGVAVNKMEALKWYRVAVERGDTIAQRRVDRLERELAAA